MKVHFMTYYDDTNDSRYLIESIRARLSGIKWFDTVTIYNRNDLIREKFYDENKHILDQKIYAGWCLWKPFFLYKKLKEVEDDDIVFYMDVGDFMYEDMKQFIIDKIEENDGFFLVQNNHSNAKWTTKDCFVFMDCDEPEYYQANQLEAGTVGFKKSDNTLDFVYEWLNYCTNEHILTTNNINENHIEYCGKNRADQSVLTNLKIKYDIKTVNIFSITKFIRHNVPGK